MKQKRYAEPLGTGTDLPGSETNDCDPAARALQQGLLAWYSAHGRNNLPWQTERTPYRVWISEIMLQQTQVASVIPYFQRFIDRFPDIGALARAPLDEILEHWSGLGYYARARNLHRAAAEVHKRFAGNIPEDLAALSALPGIGRSTAGAIRSLGHGLPAAILDGNVKRVLCRYFGIEGWPGASAVAKELWRLSEQLTPATATHCYNQAIMDLGATVCTPRDPHCGCCPWHPGCHARLTGKIAELPSCKPRCPTPIRRRLALLLVDGEGRVYLEQRPPTGVWGGLWCLPLLDHPAELEQWADHHGFHFTLIERLPTRRHTFSHFHLHYDPLQIRIETLPARIGEPERQCWLARRQACHLGLPTPMRKLLAELGYLD